VDIGSGPDCRRKDHGSQLPVAKYIGYEPSEDMRNIAQMKHQDPRISFLPLDVALRTSDTISGIYGRKIVTMNSVLHHIVWWEEYLVDVVDCLNSGDLFVICHEPIAGSGRMTDWCRSLMQSLKKKERESYG